jgi:hypothetical protein
MPPVHKRLHILLDTTKSRLDLREIYRLRQAIEEIFRGLQQELGWTGHRHWRRARLLAHLALGLVAYGLIERQREGLGFIRNPSGAFPQGRARA